MVLTLTNCSVQLKNQLTVSLARQCSAGYQALHAISSQSDLMEGVLCVLHAGMLCYFGNIKIHYPV